VAVGVETVAVPDLRNKTVQEAFQLLFAAGLAPGTESQVFDPVVPIGLIVTQAPGPGVIVNQGTAVSYAVSQGPQPSPSPTPSPTPTPAPTPTPTPPPTPTPTPSPITVGDYSCLTVSEAQAQIEDDGFTFGGNITGGGSGDWFVNGQTLPADSLQPPGSVISVSSQPDQPAGCT
jgi:serine/threonine-protein kinase